MSRHLPPGRLITLEGIDGAGKTTLATRLLAALHDRGTEIVLLREPGGVAAAERIRALVKDPGLRIDGRAEALLYAAARAQLVDEALEPLLNQGTHVLLDRFVDSSLAYQGAARGLGIDAVAAINAFATGGRRADRTLLLRIDPEAARRRAGIRGPSDRLEAEAPAFFTQIAAAYDALAAAEPDRIFTLDARKPPVELAADALAALAGLGL